jgi:hypothetical protein
MANPLLPATVIILSPEEFTAKFKRLTHVLHNLRFHTKKWDENFGYNNRMNKKHWEEQADKLLIELGLPMEHNISSVKVSGE